jgi:hypothetical protein
MHQLDTNSVLIHQQLEEGLQEVDGDVGSRKYGPDAIRPSMVGTPKVESAFAVVLGLLDMSPRQAIEEYLEAADKLLSLPIITLFL